MKLKITSYLILLFLFIDCTYAQQFHKYPIKSGKIEYVLDGNTKGYKTIWWDQYGFREAEIETSITEMFGQINQVNETTVSIGADVYQWSKTNSKIYKSSNPIVETWNQNNFDLESLDEFSTAVLNSLGFELKGTEQVMGYHCHIYKGVGTMWVWNGLMIKSEVNLLETHNLITASKIDTSLAIPESVFILPKNREIVNLDIINE